MFSFNGKEFSDEEMVKAYDKRLREIRKWCVSKAREFFADKKITKQFDVDIYYPEVDETIQVVFDDEELKKYQKAYDKWHEEFCLDYPEQKDDEDLWLSYLGDCFMEAGYTIPYYDGIAELEAEIKYIDLIHPANVYVFKVLCFADENAKAARINLPVPLTDNEYITLLADCLENPDINIGAIMNKHPQIFKKIAGMVNRYVGECAIFMSEIKADAKTILESSGSEKPKLPSSDNPLGAMVNYIYKEKKQRQKSEVNDKHSSNNAK